MSDLVENEVDGVKAKARAVPGIAHIQSYRMSDEVKNTAQKAQSFVSAASTAPVLKTRKISRLEHLASANAAFSEHHGSKLAAPAPGIYIAPMDTDGMPQVLFLFSLLCVCAFLIWTQSAHFSFMIGTGSVNFNQYSCS